jgi:hypothetical protein
VQKSMGELGMASAEIEKIIELVEVAARYGTTQSLSADRDCAAKLVNYKWHDERQ